MLTNLLPDGEEIIDAPDSVPTEMVRHFEFRAEPSDDGLTLEGYAAVFNAPTVIDSREEGHFAEEIAPGAFKRSIGQRVPMLMFDHGKHPMIGTLPIGVIRSIREDGHGLKFRARLSDNWLVQPVRDAVRDGSVTGMSFRFGVIKDLWTRAKDGMQHRRLLEVSVPELGPVVFPAYGQTTVGVRSRAALTALEDPEVRSEIARILASGTDLRSLADAAAPEPHADSEVHDPAGGHSRAHSGGIHPSLARAQMRSALLV